MRNSGPFLASCHAHKASQLPGAMSPWPAPSELRVREGRSREQSSSQLALLARRPRTTPAALPAWYWASLFYFSSTSLLPLPPCAPGWYLQVSWPWLAKVGWHCLHPGCQSGDPQVGDSTDGSVVFYSDQAFRDQA